MRILCVCRPAYGHLNPLLPLAAACRAAGHEVIFGTGEEALPRLRERGFRADRVGISIVAADQLALADEPSLASLPREQRWRIGVAVFGDVLARRTIEDLRPLLDDVTPDLVIYDETDVGAAAAAHLGGVPAVAHSLGRQLPDVIRHAVLERLQGVLRETDRDAAPGDLFAANPYLDICPPTLQDPAASEPGERILLRPVAPIEPDDVVPDWILAARSRPLAYLTLGTYVSAHVDSLRAAAAGLGTLAIDTLVTVGPDGDRSALGSLPASVRVERFVPQGVLLPHRRRRRPSRRQRHHAQRSFARAAAAVAAPRRRSVHERSGHRRPRCRHPPAARGDHAAGRGGGRSAAARGARLPASRRGLADEIAAMPSPAETVPALERLAQG